MEYIISRGAWLIFSPADVLVIQFYRPVATPTRHGAILATQPSFFVFSRSFPKYNLVYREEGPMKIGEYFVKSNYVTQEEVNEALELQKRNKDQYIGEILVKMNVITREQLITYVCEYDTRAVKETYE